MYCVTLQEAAEFAKDVYPDLKDKNFVFPDQGYENFTMMTGTEVIRIARYQYIAECMNQEVETLKAIKGELCLSTPVIYDFKPEQHIMRMSRLSGTPLLPDRLMKLSIEERENIAHQLSLFMAQMHEKFSRDRSFLKDAFKSYRSDGIEKINYLRETYLDSDMQNYLDKIRHYILGFEDHSDEPTRIHGDLKPENILYDTTTGKISIVDFTLCREGYRHQEFRQAIRDFPDTFSRAVIGRYESITGKSMTPLALLWREVVKVAEFKKERQLPFVMDTGFMPAPLNPGTFPALQG